MHLVYGEREMTDAADVPAGRWQRWSGGVVNSLERHPRRVLGGLTLLALMISATVSWWRLLWFDELVTVYIAKTGSLRAIWHALTQGADPNPPLTHVLVMWSMRLFGENHLAIRLPAIIAGTVAVAGLFVFLSRRLPVAYSALGVLAYMSTRAFDYGYEGRSYALTLCFCMLALLAWREAVEGRHRAWASVGLAICIAAGISSNYFGVLACFPIAAGEAVRAIRSRRLEMRVWLALIAGGATIFLYLPLINNAVAKFAPFAWNKPNQGFLFEAYRLLLDSGVYLAAMIVEAGAVVYLYQKLSEKRTLPRAFPLHEFVAIVTLVTYPFIGYAIAELRAGMISPRFVLPLCFGAAVLVAIALHHMFGRNRVVTAVLLFGMFSWALGRISYSASGLMEQREDFFNLMRSLPDDGVLVVPDSLAALPLYYYTPRETASRIVFPFDADAIRTYKREDSAEQNLWGGRFTFPMKISALKDVDCERDDCYIVAPDINWLITYLNVNRRPPKPLDFDTKSAHLRGEGYLFSLSFGGKFLIFTPSE